MYRTRKTTNAYKPETSRSLYSSQQLACPFCHLDDRPVHKDTESVMVIPNLHPYEFWDKRNVIEHLLLIPKRHVDNLNELSDAEKVELMNTMAEYEAAGYSVYWRSKTNGERTVPHHHTHLIKVGDKSTKFLLYAKKPYFVLDI